MKKKPEAIVIGAGIGGIANAARLARNGYNVTVFEKNSRPGGRCDQWSYDGHRFDIGPTLLLMPEVFAETYTALGERMEDHLNLQRIDPTYTVNFEDGLQIELTADLQKMQTQLEVVEKNAFDGFLRYMAEGNRHYHLSLQKFVGRNFYSIFDYFSLSNLPLLFQLKALVKHYANIGRYFNDARLRALFTFQNMYLGLSPYDAPATYSLLQYTELAGGVWYPRGGMYRVIESLEEIARSLGVNFIYDTPVRKLNAAENRIDSIELETGEQVSADLFVGNADLPYMYKELLPDLSKTRELNDKKYTCSTIMFYWGVDKIYSQLGHHNVFLAGEYKASFDSIFTDLALPSEPSFYVNAPGRTDASVAPPGQDSLYVLIPVGHLSGDRRQDWGLWVNQARQVVFDRLARQLGITDLAKHLKFERVITPLDWKSIYNLEKGAAFGLSHNFAQVGYLRPHNRHDRFHNLYFSGASTHPGTGLPIVLLSARLTAERIIRDVGQYNDQYSNYPVRLPSTLQKVENNPENSR